jgi:competence protein ComEC
MAIGAQERSLISGAESPPAILRTANAAAQKRAEYFGVAPIYLVAAAVVAGDACGNAGLSCPYVIVIIVACAATLAYLKRHAEVGLALSLAVIAAASATAAFQIHHPVTANRSIRRFPDHSRVELEGFVARPSDYLDGGGERIYVAVEKAALTGHPMTSASGLLRITSLEKIETEPGDKVRVACLIRYPRQFGDTGEFDYTGYLDRQGITATMFIPTGRKGSSIAVIRCRRRSLERIQQSIRRRIRAVIGSAVSGPEGAVLRAIVLGDRDGIDQALRDRFARAGMAHLLVISGLHMGLVAAAVFALVRSLLGLSRSLTERGLGNPIAAASALIAVMLYAALAREHISTMRALIMVSVYMVAVVINRARAVMASLALAALAICLAYPGSTADAAFQLSFAVVALIILGMRRTTGWQSFMRAGNTRQTRAGRWSARIIALVAASVAVSFWATIGAAPLTARHFNQVSVVGLVANAITVPIVGSAATIVGLCGAALSLLSAPAASIVFVAAGRLVGIGIALAGWFLRWPVSWVRIFTPTWFEVGLAYGGVALWLLSSNDSASEGWSRLLLRATWAVLVIAIVADAAWWTSARYLSPLLRITFLAVGEGDAAVVRFPGSKVMLIDAGGSFGRLDSGRAVVAPFLWSQKIMRVDYLVISHPDLDHFGGFAFIAKNFHPAVLWTGPAPGHDRSYQRLLKLFDTLNVRRREVDDSASPVEIGGVAVRCLGPQVGDVRDNDASVVLRFDYGKASVLFTGDIEAHGERSLLESRENLRATVLKAPHHGSSTSSTTDFVRAVDPALVVLSLGYMNHYGFPSPAVVDRYRAIGAELARTDEMGEIDVTLGKDSVEASSFSGAMNFKRHF